MIRYLKVKWHHDLDNEPILLLSKIEYGREVRKVEKFRDGRIQYAGPEGCTGDTLLSETLMPLPEEIEQDPQFSVEPMSADEFDLEWQCATSYQS